MKKRLIIGLLPITLIGLMLFQGGCVKENFDTVPYLRDSSKLSASITIKGLKKTIKALSSTSTIKSVKNAINESTNPDSLWKVIIDNNKLQGVIKDTSVVIYGYVTSCDSTGNFYEVVTIQDSTGGIDIKINDADIYTLYRLRPGQKVMVKLNNLYLGTYNGIHQIGAAIVEEGALKIVGIPPSKVNSYIERQDWRITKYPDTVTISELLADVTGYYVQRFICVKNVQFKDPFNCFAIPGVNTNRTLVDDAGNMLILRTSGYSTFAQDTVPGNSGTITGILSTYNSSSGNTRQLAIRDLKDINFKYPRTGSTIPTPNTTIVDLKAMCTSSSLNITTDVVISGVVTGNDESGNLYKVLNLQDETGGITFSINIGGLYPEYPVGTQIVVNCNGLCVGKYGGVVQLGMPPYSTYVTRLDASTFYTHVFITGAGITVAPVVTTIGEINDNMINKLITLKDVQFIDSEMGKTYTEPNINTNRNLENIVGSKIIVRSSSYANFANTTLPYGSGNVTAILTKYSSDYQLAIRDLGDVRLIKPRFTYIFSEGFTSATVGSVISVNGWKTVAEAGTKVFMAKQYSGDTYAEMNPFNSGEASNIAWLVSPAVNITGITNPTLIFQTEYAYWDSGTSYYAYISTNYNGGSNISDITSATWTPLSSARLVQQSDGANKWIGSGLVDLSTYTGNVYIAFKYISSGGSYATAFRVDNMKIFSKQ